MTIQVVLIDGDQVHVTTPVAEPGPLVAMKLQAVMNRSTNKQGTDLQDVVRLVLDRSAGPTALEQIGTCEAPMPADIAAHVDRWLRDLRADTFRWIRTSGGGDLTIEDIDLADDLIAAACSR